jgi:membrane-associated phospholipid phosphatase
LILTAFVPLATWAQSTDDPGFDVTPKMVLDDAKDYLTSPLHWNRSDWVYFGGALAAVGLAHHYDDSVRAHFAAKLPNPLASKDTHDGQDAIPAAAIIAGTWFYATISDDNWGRKEGWSMVEAATFSVGTAYVFKFAAGRERPDQTADDNRWRKGGSSFPSVHATAAFAIGTVLAESGDDDYRWLRRFIGYGIAAGTGYERLKHNAHWLSDVVAGAALGASSARFVLHRGHAADLESSIALVPTPDGVMLTYNQPLR